MSSGGCAFFLKGQLEQLFQCPSQACRRFLSLIPHVPCGLVSCRIQVCDVTQRHRPVNVASCLRPFHQVDQLIKGGIPVGGVAAEPAGPFRAAFAELSMRSPNGSAVGETSSGRAVIPLALLPISPSSLASTGVMPSKSTEFPPAACEKFSRPPWCASCPMTAAGVPLTHSGSVRLSRWRRRGLLWLNCRPPVGGPIRPCPLTTPTVGPRNGGPLPVCFT